MSTKRKNVPLWRALPNGALITYIQMLRHLLRNAKSLLDVGCGIYSPMRFVDIGRQVGVDGYLQSIQEAERNRTHDEYVHASIDALPDLFADQSFDAVVALDVIEHLPKENGDAFLKHMERIAKKTVIVFTPNGFIPQKSHDGNLQEHVSGWTAQELRAKGYTVYGVYGVKQLRGEYHTLKYGPTFFWGIVSEITQYLWCVWHPESAAAILCVKDMEKNHQLAIAAVTS